MKTTAPSSSPPILSARRTAGVAVVTVFAALSIASGNSKTEPSKQGTTAAAVGTDPSKGATLVGSCDRSDTYNKDCTESYAPTTTSEAKDSCKSLGGKFRIGPCPRIDAVTACYEGYAPHLSASFAYEGRKSKTEAGDCNRWFKDLKKEPELKPSAQPASCNAVATGGTCTVFAQVNAEAERMCLENGGRLEQPPKPCPASNGLAAFKFTKDGVGWTEYFYTSEYKDADGSHTWKLEDVLLICGLAGSSCEKVAFAPGGDAPAASASARTATPAKPAAKAAKPAAKK